MVNKIIEDTNEHITPHYLRHTYSTDLHKAGVDDFTRKTFLGHSIDDDVTFGYTTMTEEARTLA